MLRAIQLPFQLRPYQHEAVEALLRRRKGIIIMPTGTGKTAIAIQCIKRIGLPTAILVPTINLAYQWRDKLREAKAYSTLFYGGEKRISRITIFVYNSAIRHLNRLKPFGFIIIDEVHHLAAPKLRALLDVAAEKPYALGLTSCIRRADGEEWIILRRLPVIYQMYIRDAMRKGYVSKLKIYKSPVYMTPKERALYRLYTETIQRAVIYFRVRGYSLQEILKLNHPMVQKYLSALAKRKTLLSNVKAKLERVYQLVSMHPDEKILLFSESIESIEALRRYLLKKGIRAGIYHSKMTLEERRRHLQLWRQGYYQTLLSVRCLEEGTDVPEVRIGIIIASGKTDRQMIQRIGRLIRPRDPSKPGVIYIVYCVGTVEEEYAYIILQLLRRR